MSRFLLVSTGQPGDHLPVKTQSEKLIQLKIKVRLDSVGFLVVFFQPLFQTGNLRTLFFGSGRGTITSAAALCLRVGAGWPTPPCQVSGSTDYSTTTSVLPRSAQGHPACCSLLIESSHMRSKLEGFFFLLSSLSTV